MVKRDTRNARRRASLATSSMTNSADSRVSAPCRHICVIPLSTAQMHFGVLFVRESASRSASTRSYVDDRGVPNDLITETRRSRIQNQAHAFDCCSEVPLSATAHDPPQEHGDGSWTNFCWRQGAGR